MMADLAEAAAKWNLDHPQDFSFWYYIVTLSIVTIPWYMKPKGPILSFATSLPYSTAMRPHICESPCMSMQEKRNKRDTDFESPRIRRALFCPVLPGAGMPRHAVAVNPRASSCPSWCWDPHEGQYISHAALSCSAGLGCKNPIWHLKQTKG